jgi:hypothetical protein
VGVISLQISQNFTQRIVSTTWTAALVEILEFGRPYPVLWVEVLHLWDDPMVLLKLWDVTVGDFDCILPTGCYMFMLRDICDIQCARLVVSIVYLGMCVETGVPLTDIMRHLVYDGVYYRQ